MRPAWLPGLSPSFIALYARVGSVSAPGHGRMLGMAPDPMRIRRAEPEDGKAIRDLTAASKGHWAYPPARVREWADRLDLSAARIAAGELYVAEIDGRGVGWVEILPPDGGVCVLDHLWIEPARMGRELGTRLFRHAVARARELGAHRLEWEAEPNATGFYERMGGRRPGTNSGPGGARFPSWVWSLRNRGISNSRTSGPSWFDAHTVFRRHDDAAPY